MQIVVYVCSCEYYTVLEKQAGETFVLIKYLHGYGNSVASQPFTAAKELGHLVLPDIKTVDANATERNTYFRSMSTSLRSEISINTLHYKIFLQNLLVYKCASQYVAMRESELRII